MSITYTIFDDSTEESIEIRVQMLRDEIESTEKAHYEMVNGDTDFSDEEISTMETIITNKVSDYNTLCQSLPTDHVWYQAP
jgi:galactose-1-phosphate uridylyltransferase